MNPGQHRLCCLRGGLENSIARPEGVEHHRRVGKKVVAPLRPEPDGIGKHFQGKCLGEIVHCLHVTLLEEAVYQKHGLALEICTQAAHGDMILCNPLRVRSCSGGSVSSTMLLGRHGNSLAKSCRPTPRADE